MSTRIYNIHWHGPFTKEQVEEIQRTSSIYELYLLKGKKPHAKKYHYYCGESHGRSADIRLFDDNHHIKDYRDGGIEEIWLGDITNAGQKPETYKRDVLLTEHLLIAYLVDIFGENNVLNRNKLYYPKENICILNQWFKGRSEELYLRTKEGSIASIIPDVIRHSYNEDESIHQLYTADKVKHVDTWQD